MTPAEPPLRLERVERHFKEGRGTLDVLRGADLELRAGELVGLIGPSGAGKSTLLHIAGLLERPDAGEVVVLGRPTGRLPDRERTELRRVAIGFVYQFHHLLPEFSALENVMLPQMIRGLARREAKARARALLAMLGLSDREAHRPAELSGGEQQRVAIARAVANVPSILLADEPTGNLDPKTASSVSHALETLVRETGLAALVATHNLDLAARMDRRITIDNGLVHDV